MPKQDFYDDEAAAVPAAEAPSPDGPPVPKSPAEVCRAVERVMDREPLDRVKCSHLFGDYYRCNWWSRVAKPRTTQDYDWANTLSDHVRDSRFLRVTVGPAGVEARPVTARPSGGGADE